MIRATCVYCFIGVYILLLAPLTLLWSLISGDTRLLYIMARFCIRAGGLIGGIRISIRGRERIIPGKTFLFLSNHQGNIDGPVLCHATPRNLRALIKAEIMKLPILSLVFKQARFVPVERLNPKKARESIDLGARLLSEGLSFFAFPEGTRSRDGRLGEFKKGAFIMAIKAQVPVIPVTIAGSAVIQPPGKYSIRAGRVRVVFHEPIDTKGMDLDDRDRLADLTRKAIASGLNRHSKHSNASRSTG
ncbi:MAG: 1-acyl-sn-glycerol-3-phosphate acyltransferase [Acidobacteria bacterium]|nr:1-acyl-sn-glycerol-3-phosphate acyltransferase [Acidobacteriota bacterium]